MTKTLKRITGLCGAALMVLPMAAGMENIQQNVSPTTVSAKRRRRIRKPRVMRLSGFSGRRSSQANTLRNRIIQNVEATQPKRHRRRSKKQNDAAFIKYLETPKRHKKAFTGRIANPIPMTSVANHAGSEAEYVPASTYNSIVNDPQLWNSTKQSVLSLEAMPAGNAPTEGTVTFADGDTFDTLTGKNVPNPVTSANASAPSASVNIDQFHPASAASKSISRPYLGTPPIASATSTQASEFHDNFEQPTVAVQSGLDNDAINFANAVETSPIKSASKNSLVNKFGTNPQSAASKFADEVNGVNPNRVKKDSAFQSAMSSATAPSASIPSLAYSTNPKKAASAVSSMESSAGLNTKSAKNDPNNAPIDVTNNPLNADQSAILNNQRNAMNDLIHGVNNAGNNSTVNTNAKNNGNIKPANTTLEKTPEMLNGTTALKSGPENGQTVLGIQQIQQNNQDPNYGNTFMIYQQDKLKDGTMMDHVVSYDGKYKGWIPDSGIQASAKPGNAAIPSGTYHFKNPSKDATYELPLGTSWADPYVLNRTDSVGADNLQVTAAKTANKNGKTITSYYVKDASHPYINGWVNANELSKVLAKNASSKKANTPKSTGSNVTKFNVNIEGNLSEAPAAVNADKAGTDSLRFPRVFSNDQVKALHGTKGSSIDWNLFGKQFFNKDRNMNKFYGTATYYKQNGHVVYVPKSDIKTAQASGKVLFHYVYKIDKSATRRANKNTKNGDIVNIYYRRVQVNGPAKDVNAKTPKNNNKVVSNKSNQKPSNADQAKVSTPKTTK